MPDHELTLDEVRKMAAEFGLDRLTDEHLRQFLRAANAARARRDVLQSADLGPADEPAHFYRIGEDESR